MKDYYLFVLIYQKKFQSLRGEFSYVNLIIMQR